MIPNFASELLEPREALELQKSLRLWAISFLVFGGISVYGEEMWDIAWGVILIIAVLLALKFKSPAMFIVFSVIMAWSAFINTISILLGEGADKLWYLVGLAQALWIVFATKQYEKYRHLGKKNETQVLEKLTKGSTTLSLFSMVLLVLPVNSCVNSSPDTLMAPWWTDLMDALLLAFMDFNALALGLGLAVYFHMNRSSRQIPEGVYISAVLLAGILGLFILGALV